MSGSLIRPLEMSSNDKSPCFDARIPSPGVNPFARVNSPGPSAPNPFSSHPSSPLPAVSKTPSKSPVIGKSPKSEIVLTNWDEIYSTDRMTELPSPHKSASQSEFHSPKLFGKSRAARTAPGQSRGAESSESSQINSLAKKESRRDVRTAGNALDIVKDRRPVEKIERRKGSRRAAGRVARAVSEQNLPTQSDEKMTKRGVSGSSNRLGPAQILREARMNSSKDKKDDNSVSSITLNDVDDISPTLLGLNILSSSNKDKSVNKL